MKADVKLVLPALSARFGLCAGACLCLANPGRAGAPCDLP